MSKFENKQKKGAGKSKAVALRYRISEDASPVVIASGYGTVADKIVGIAEEKGIPVFKDDSTASMLCMLEVGRNIPPELYEVIAAIYMQILSASQEILGTSSQSADTPRSAEQIRAQLEHARNAISPEK